MNRQMEVHYIDTGFQYSATESFMDFFEHLVYSPHVAYSENSMDQDGAYWLRHASPLKEERVTHENFQEVSDSHSYESSEECARFHDGTSQGFQDLQDHWQGNVDPDNMTYEELLELADTIGTQNRGLPAYLIAELPITKHKGRFFSWRKKQCKRCVICQMKFKWREELITLPCKHVYHAGCISKWLGINKVCPICSVEVYPQDQKHSSFEELSTL